MTYIILKEYNNLQAIRTFIKVCKIPTQIGQIFEFECKSTFEEFVFKNLICGEYIIELFKYRDNKLKEIL